mgnify:CR=1 FL=1
MMKTAGFKNALVFPFAPPMISGFGTTNGVEMYVQDKSGGTVEALNEVTTNFLAALNQRPEVAVALTTFNPRFPQYRLEVDAVRCKRQNVSPSDVLNTLSMYIGGSYSSNINLFSKQYHVMVQADQKYRLDTAAFKNMFVRSSTGQMLPVGQFLKLQRVNGPEMLSRFNLFSSISVNAAANEGYSSGNVINAIAEVAATTLPQGYGYDFGGMSREEATQGNTTLIVYALCVIFVYLILCCLYESMLVPLSVLLSVPAGLFGAFLSAYLLGLENNIYMQTGVIMLMGLVSKTAILMTQYATDRRRQGMEIVEAALSAARDRLRPILMTAICMIVGLMPLVVAHGAGANGSRSLGTGVVGGMLIGTVFLLLVTPACWIVARSVSEHFAFKDPDRLAGLQR